MNGSLFNCFYFYLIPKLFIYIVTRLAENSDESISCDNSKQLKNSSWPELFFQIKFTIFLKIRNQFKVDFNNQGQDDPPLRCGSQSMATGL